jgi:hypothetical protein
VTGISGWRLFKILWVGSALGIIAVDLFFERSVSWPAILGSGVGFAVVMVLRKLTV